MSWAETWLLVWSRDGGRNRHTAVEAGDRFSAIEAWRKLPDRQENDVVMSVTREPQAIEAARRAGDIPTPATDPKDRLRMLGGGVTLANAMVSALDEQFPLWGVKSPTAHDTSVSFVMTSPDEAEYTVSVVMTKPAPKPLPTKPGAIVTWQRDGSMRIAQLNNTNVWVMLSRGSVFSDSTPAALLDYLTTNNIEWDELVVKG